MHPFKLLRLTAVFLRGRGQLTSSSDDLRRPVQLMQPHHASKLMPALRAVVLHVCPLLGTTPCPLTPERFLQVASDEMCTGQQYMSNLDCGHALTCAMEQQPEPRLLIGLEASGEVSMVLGEMAIMFSKRYTAICRACS